MEEKLYTTIPYPNFSFSEFVADKANRFCQTEFTGVQFNVREEISSIEDQLYLLNKNEHKVQFLAYVINVLIERVDAHVKCCNRPGCRVEPESQEILYNLYGKLEDLGLEADVESFSKEEIIQNYTLLDEISYKLEEVKAGQAIIYDEVQIQNISSLQEDVHNAKGLLAVLGKKKWIKYLAGVIADNVGSEAFQIVLPFFKRFGQDVIKYLRQ